MWWARKGPPTLWHQGNLGGPNVPFLQRTREIIGASSVLNEKRTDIDNPRPEPSSRRPRSPQRIDGREPMCEIATMWPALFFPNKVGRNRDMIVCEVSEEAGLFCQCVRRSAWLKPIGPIVNAVKDDHVAVERTRPTTNAGNPHSIKACSHQFCDNLTKDVIAGPPASHVAVLSLREHCGQEVVCRYSGEIGDAKRVDRRSKPNEIKSTLTSSHFSSHAILGISKVERTSLLGIVPPGTNTKAHRFGSQA